MKPRHLRLLGWLAVLGLLGLALALLLRAFEQNLVFFFTPSQVQTGQAPEGRSFRVGGLVTPGSVQREADGLGLRFEVGDGAHQLPVRYRGVLPDLFREGKGVVAQGRWMQGEFAAELVMAKHDENYLPPEAAHALEAAQAATNAGGKP